VKIGIKWNGLKELKRDLATYAGDLTTGTRPIVDTSANAAAQAMRAAYPRSGRARRAVADPGPLAASVVVDPARTTATSTSVTVRNTAFYAGWFENGTRYTSPGRVFYPIVRAAKRMMRGAIMREFKNYNLRVRT